MMCAPAASRALVIAVGTASGAPQEAELDRKAAAVGDLRRTAASQWTKGAAGDQAYYFDTRGDRDNSVYGGIYRMDLAAYQRYDPAGVSRGAQPKKGFAFDSR
jgi:hypothetical protein